MAGARFPMEDVPSEAALTAQRGRVIVTRDAQAIADDTGLGVLTACSHAGVINMLTHARDCFPGVKLHAVLGGLQLSAPQTVAALGDLGLDVIAAGHCTGWRAMSALANAFGDGKLVSLAVGKRMRF